MALTALQRRICRLIAANRIASGESYVAGGVALNELLAGRRVSRDIDLFHDTHEAVATSWESDRRLLTEAGLTVTLLRERPSFIEAEAADASEAVWPLSPDGARPPRLSSTRHGSGTRLRQRRRAGAGR
jgi:hypothetical protein